MKKIITLAATGLALGLGACGFQPKPAASPPIPMACDIVVVQATNNAPIDVYVIEHGGTAGTPITIDITNGSGHGVIDAAWLPGVWQHASVDALPLQVAVKANGVTLCEEAWK